MSTANTAARISCFQVEFDDKYDDEATELHSKFHGVGVKFNWPSGLFSMLGWLLETLQYGIYFALILAAFRYVQTLWYTGRGAAASSVRFKRSV